MVGWTDLFGENVFFFSHVSVGDLIYHSEDAFFRSEISSPPFLRRQNHNIFQKALYIKYPV